MQHENQEIIKEFYKISEKFKRNDLINFYHFQENPNKENSLIYCINYEKITNLIKYEENITKIDINSTKNLAYKILNFTRNTEILPMQYFRAIKNEIPILLIFNDEKINEISSIENIPFFYVNPNNSWQNQLFENLLFDPLNLQYPSVFLIIKIMKNIDIYYRIKK